jgi:hypothetical protein
MTSVMAAVTTAAPSRIFLAECQCSIEASVLKAQLYLALAHYDGRQLPPMTPVFFGCPETRFQPSMLTWALWNAKTLQSTL